jgi:hypothetical protein
VQGFKVSRNVCMCLVFGVRFASLPASKTCLREEWLHAHVASRRPCDQATNNGVKRGALDQHIKASCVTWQSHCCHESSQNVDNE